MSRLGAVGLELASPFPECGCVDAWTGSCVLRRAAVVVGYRMRLWIVSTSNRAIHNHRIVIQDVIGPDVNS